MAGREPGESRGGTSSSPPKDHEAWPQELPDKSRPLFTGHLLCAGTLELLRTQREPGASSHSLGKTIPTQPEKPKQGAGAPGGLPGGGDLGRSSGGAKHVQMRVQKKGSRVEEQELRRGLEVIYFNNSPGSTV